MGLQAGLDRVVVAQLLAAETRRIARACMLFFLSARVTLCAGWHVQEAGC